MNLEQTIQIISIISFIISIVVFFIKLGEYKSATNTDIITLKYNINEQKNEIKEIQKEIDEIKTNNAQNSSRFEAILIEVRTKLEFLISITGVFKGNTNVEHERDKS